MAGRKRRAFYSFGRSKFDKIVFRPGPLALSCVRNGTNGRIFDERDIRRMEVQALPLGSLFRANSPHGK